ncbi:MAG: hypothetical protein RMM51_12010 [Verrucomicrobiae bacterium]|nr:hypothetical protein [Verrucomicrobiae bacterium]
MSKPKTKPKLVVWVTEASGKPLLSSKNESWWEHYTVRLPHVTKDSVHGSLCARDLAEERRGAARYGRSSADRPRCGGSVGRAKRARAIRIGGSHD